MILTIEKMVKAGVHFGHPKSEQNPRMSPFIYTEKNNIQIIDIIQTYFYIKKTSRFLFESCSKGKRILFVGTNKYISRLIKKRANESDSWYVNKRWLGGLLTNWKTLQNSIIKLRELDWLEKKGYFSSLSKKETSHLKKKKNRLTKYFGGLKTMFNLPDIIIIAGQLKELNAIRESKILNITLITIVDTNCDPYLSDFFIPANDDSITSLDLIFNEFIGAIKEGRKTFLKMKMLK
uniref:Small ribosomal subunit protein uS2c n=1 Tax=Avrainvillea sp. HV04061 TaxID=2364086 RepID=A0A3B8D8W3_9CHLO|nr:ribosomal protein S2 [Avrainvillea sp. HV04061]